MGAIQGPDTLGEPSHHHLGVADTKDSVHQHVLETATHLQDGLPGCDLACAKQMPHILEPA